MTQHNIIDVHTHCITPEYAAAMKAAGVNDVEGYPTPQWSEEEHLAVMEKHGIQTSMISVSTPGIDFVEKSKRPGFARGLNEGIAERRIRTKGRFGAITLVPLPDVDAALKEIEYGLDTLKMDGIGVLSNYDGQYIGDSEFEPIYAELDRRSAVLFVHPTAPPHWKEFSVGYPATALEYPFDISRWLLKIVSSGVLRRYKNLKLIATHGGGTIPFLASRVATLTGMESRLNPKMTAEEVQHSLRRIYYDATSVTDPITFDAYKAFVPADRRLFGSDHPFMPDSSVPPALKVLSDHSRLDPEERRQLEWQNPLSLFPGLEGLWEKA